MSDEATASPAPSHRGVIILATLVIIARRSLSLSHPSTRTLGPSALGQVRESAPTVERW